MIEKLLTELLDLFTVEALEAFERHEPFEAARLWLIVDQIYIRRLRALKRTRNT